MLPPTVTDWSVEDVCLFLREFQVDEAVIAGVKASGIAGKDLAKLTDDDLTLSLSVPPHQAREIRQELLRRGVPAPPAPQI